MNRLLILILLCIASHTLHAEEKDSIIIFIGVVLDRDSIPVENAYLINYRSLRANATNSKGQFSIKLQKGDSLKIHHVSFDPIIVKPNSKNTPQTFVLNFEENILEIVEVKYKDIEMVYFKKNMDLIRQQLAKEFHYNYGTGYVSNPYNPARSHTGIVGINLFEVINLIKRKRN